MSLRHLLNCKNAVLRLFKEIKARIDHAMPIHNHPIELSKTIEESLLNFKEMHYKMAIIPNALKNFILRRQKNSKSLLDYTHGFKVACRVIMLHASSLFFLK